MEEYNKFIKEEAERKIRRKRGTVLMSVIAVSILSLIMVGVCSLDMHKPAYMKRPVPVKEYYDYNNTGGDYLC